MLIVLSLLWLVNPVSASQLNEIKTLIASGDLSDALALIKSELSIDPTNGEIAFLEATILEKKGNVVEAIDRYQLLTDTHPEMPEPYNNLAVHYANNGDLDLAIESLESALGTHPSYATAYQNLISIYNQIASQSYRIALNSDAPPEYAQLTSMTEASFIGFPVSNVVIQEETIEEAAQEEVIVASNDTTAILSSSSGVIDTTQPIAEPDDIPSQEDTTTQEGRSDTEVSATNEPVDITSVTPDNPDSETSTLDTEQTDIIDVEVAVSEIDTQIGDASDEQIEEVVAGNDSEVVVQPTSDEVTSDTAQPEANTSVISSISDDEILQNQQLQQQKNEIIKQLKHWAESWSSQSVDEYLAHYSGNFVPRGISTLEAWKKQRESRLLLRDFINVDISQFNVDITENGERATVNFTQHYKSNVFEDTIRKTVELELSGEQWLILSEQI